MADAQAKLFISYSRRDAAFADRLDAALQDKGFKTLVDRSEIGAFEDWWDRLKALIAQADTVVYVISPDSIASRVCREEIAFAASLGKRFAPIDYRAVDAGTIPTALSSLNFVPFREDQPFDHGVERLVVGLMQNLGWIRNHTRFGEAARAWETGGRVRGLLMRTPSLQQAEAWQRGRPQDEPDIPEAITQFITASRRGFWRRVAVRTVASLLLLVFIGGNAGLIARMNYDEGFRERTLTSLWSYLLDIQPGEAATKQAEAEELLRRLIALDKEHPSRETKIKLVEARHRVAEIFLGMGDRTAADNDAYRAFYLAHQLAKDMPNDADTLKRVIFTGSNAGTAAALVGNLQRAMSAWRTAIMQFERLEKIEKAEPGIRVYAARAYQGLAGAQPAAGDALRWAEKSLALFKAVAGEGMAVDDLSLGIAVSTVGNTQLARGQRDVARVSLLEAKEILKRAESTAQAKESAATWSRFNDGLIASLDSGTAAAVPKLANAADTCAGLEPVKP